MAETFTPISDPSGNLQFEALLEQVCGVAAIYGGVKQDAQDLLDLCGGGEVVAWAFTPESATPDLAVVRQGSHWYIWVAGTVNLTQWIANVTGSLAVTSINPNVYANRFFWLAAETLLQVGGRFLPPLTPDLRITFVGHSMGAAVAFAMWYMLRGRYPGYQVELLQLAPAKLFTFGLNNPSPSTHFLVRVPGDPVVMVPPPAQELMAVNPILGAPFVFSNGLGWCHYGKPYQLSRAGQLTQDLPQQYWNTVPLQWLYTIDTSAHPIASYASFIREGIVDPYPVTPRARRVLGLLETVAAHPPQPNQSIPFDPAAATDPAQSNQAYFGSTTGPITQANADRAQSLSILVTSAVVQPGSNIQGFLGVTPMASGIWKFTAMLRGKVYGKSTSVFFSGNPDINQAVTAGKAWANALSFTLGNAGTPNAYDDGPNEGSPVITYLRVTDAINPRVGMLVELDNTSAAYSGEPGVTAGTNSADFTSTALSLRMTGFTQTVPVVQGFSNHTILYQPDAVVVNGSQIDLTHKDGYAKPYSQRVSDYLNYLTSQGNALGFCVIDPAEVKKNCTSFAFVNGIWQATCTAHGYATGDKVRLTAANAKGFAGTYVVNVIDPNTIAFNSGPPSSIPAPTKAKVQRIQTSAGVKLVKFAQFTKLPVQMQPPFGLRVTKRNPGRPFVPVSFKRRARRLH